MKKDEKKTILYGSDAVEKDCPQIALRGEIDSLYARAVYTCAFARQYGYIDILGNLEDVVKTVRELMRSEALGSSPQITHIMGLSFDELRHISHHPQEELGIEGFMPDENTTEMTALINLLRAEARRAERVCVYAEDDGPVNREIQVVLNRLSSALYIIMLESGVERY